MENSSPDFNSSFKPLYQRLITLSKFRVDDFTASVRGMMAKHAANGLANSGVVLWDLSQEFAKEAEKRAEDIGKELRNYRSSCSPQQIYESRVFLEKNLGALLEKTLEDFKLVVEKASGISARREHNQLGLADGVFDQNTSNAISRARMLVQASVSEVVIAANTAITAQSSKELPTYFFQNTFNGSVGNFAQGQGSVFDNSQHNVGINSEQLANAMSTLLDAIQKSGATDPGVTGAVQVITENENRVRKGGTPVLVRLKAAIDMIRTSEDIAIKAPEVVDRLQHLAQFFSNS